MSAHRKTGSRGHGQERESRVRHDAVEALRQVLRRAALFSAVSDEQREQLVCSASLERCRRGEEIFTVGAPATEFVLVVEGALKVYILAPDGREQILHLARPGDLVAEGAALAHLTYPASAMATQDSLVARFSREKLVTLVRDDPELAMAMIAGLSRRLKGFVATIGDLSLRDVTARLARFVLENAVGDLCPLPGTKSQLAAQLGTVPEPLSRSLRRLKEAGIIEEGRRGLAIRDREALRALVEGES